MTSPSWYTYSNTNATRNKPVTDELIAAMGFLPDMGLRMDIISGGQDKKGHGHRRTGSTRHDEGRAADVDFYSGDRKLDWNNAEDLPIFEDIVRKAKAAGVTGIGAGNDYMGAGRMHIGYGNPGVWGAGGKGANAPGWLRAAYEGVDAPPSAGVSHGGSVTPSTTAGADAVAKKDEKEAKQYAGFQDVGFGMEQDRSRFEGKLGRALGLHEGGARDRMLAGLGMDNNTANRMGQALAGLGGQIGRGLW